LNAGFPDCFPFGFTRTSAQRQIGNAVPPILGFQIGKSILSAFLSRRLGEDDGLVVQLQQLHFAHHQWPIAAPLYESDFPPLRENSSSSEYKRPKAYLHLGEREDSSSPSDDDDRDDSAVEKSDIDTSDADSEELQRRKIKFLNDPRKPFQCTRRRAKRGQDGVPKEIISIDEQEASRVIEDSENDVSGEVEVEEPPRRPASPKKRKRASQDVNIEDLSIYNSPSVSSDEEDDESGPQPPSRKRQHRASSGVDSIIEDSEDVEEDEEEEEGEEEEEYEEQDEEEEEGEEQAHGDDDENEDIVIDNDDEYGPNKLVSGTVSCNVS
jgi:hypothetical protein